MVYELKHFYKIYVNRGGKQTWREFKLTMRTFLANMRDGMLEGEKYELGYHLGKMKVGRFERSFTRRSVNWGESNKYKQRLLDEGKSLFDKETGEGFEWLVYFTDRHYYGFYWQVEKIRDINYATTLNNRMFYELKTYKKTKMKLASVIDEMSPIIYEPILNTKMNGA